MMDRILFVSNSNSRKINHILDALLNRKDAKVKVEHLYHDKTNQNGLFFKLCSKLGYPIDSDGINKRIIKEVKDFKPTLIFIVKGNNIYPSTLRKIKSINENIRLVSWSLDDMFVRHNRSVYYKKGLEYYDSVYTTKSYNVEELKKFKAKNINFIYQAYSRKYHIKSNIGDDFKNDVLFIGYAEQDRFECIKYLAKNGIKIKVFGSGWNKPEFKIKNANVEINDFDLLGFKYSNEISSSKITLCFLRKINRDLHTSRSMEIPACGGFMLGERTSEHLDIFEEGVESEFFSGKKELLEKVNYYLYHDKERNLIRDNGYYKITNGCFCYDSMLERIIRNETNNR